jgi:DNA-binding transcriptional regulator YdaS (Cro superfamily)
MRNRTRVIAAAAVTAALAAGSTAAAVASTTSAKPSAPAKTVSVSVSEKCATESDLAARLGVSTAQLDQAGRTVKTSLNKAHAQPTEDQFQAALARNLGISRARVRQAFAAGTPDACQPAGSKATGSKDSGSKSASSRAAEQHGHDMMTAAVARELHVSTARVSAALEPLFAVGHADPSSPVFAAAARSLGVSTQQLSTALMHAKQSLAGNS